METDKYPCPICGTLCLGEEEGSYDICPVCGWEEDGYQKRHPDEQGGPNKNWTLNAAKKAWEKGETIFPRYPNPNAKK